MRGLMIGAGAALLHSFHWLTYFLGAFLVVTGLRWAVARQAAVRPEQSRHPPGAQVLPCLAGV